jgi:hypothetical protein
MFDLIPHRKGATNRVPSFLTRYGPIREVRFAKGPDGRADGGVHQLFTVVGRSDVFPASQPGICTDTDLPQPDFETEYHKGNLRFRIPLQLFGPGILDGIQDREIMGRHQDTVAVRAELGIGGIANRSANDPRLEDATCYGPSEANAVITRFRALSSSDQQAILDFLRAL